MSGKIFVTSAVNDQDLVKALGSMAVAIPLPHTDALFFGVNDAMETIRIGAERKRLSDMANSILGGRYLYQAQAAHEAYIDVLVLIVEGDMRPSPEDGLVEIPVWRPIMTPNSLKPKMKQVWEPLKPSISYSRWCQYLHELAYLAGILVMRSSDVKETAAIIKALWLNFQTPPSGHNSLKQIYKQPTGIQLVKPSLIRRVAAELPGIGWERSAEVAQKFRSVKEMVDADVKSWLEIGGIGKKTAEKAVSSLRGEG